MFNVKVGDVIVDAAGDEAKVFEVGQTSLLRSIRKDFSRACEWQTFEHLEKTGWKIKGQESDEVEVICRGIKKTIPRGLAKAVGLI